MQWRLSSMMVGAFLVGGLLSIWTNFGPLIGFGTTFVFLLVIAHVCGARLGVDLQSLHSLPQSADDMLSFEERADERGYLAKAHQIKSLDHSRIERNEGNDNTNS